MIESVGDSISKTVTKVARWGLALFGIRSIYLGLRQAMNTISQYNDEMANKIESIKYSLAMALEPIISRIVNLIYKMVQYLGYIIKAWTGKDIFENAQKNLGKANKSAKDLKKTMAGFDTANVLANTSASGGTDSGVSALEIPEGEMPKWVDWIARNKDIVLGFLGAALGLITAIKLVGLASELKKLFDWLKPIGAWISKNSGVIAGIVLIISGIAIAIKGVIDYLKNPTWENFGKIIVGIGIAILGLAVILGSIPLAIAGVIVIITGLVVMFWDKIKAFIDTKIIGGLDKIIKWLEERHLGFIAFFVQGFKEAIQTVVGFFDYLFTGVKQILDGIINIFKGNFKQGFTQIFKGIGNICIGVLNTLIGGLNAVISPIRALIVTVGKVMGKSWTMDNIKIPSIPKLAVGGIVSMPGRGVPIGGAMTGESGMGSREGVLPLTNSQAMAQLGQEIGKWISVNVDLTTKLDSRVLSRSLEKVQSNKSFIRNGV